MSRTLITAAAAALSLTLPAAAAAAECPNADAVSVPGAEFQEQACLGDMTTSSTQFSGHTDRSDWNGLHAGGTRNPTGVPGLQVDGYFPDTSTTNAYKGRNHDSQFVIRLPDEWNGKLVITGAPGVRRQFAHDFIVSDWVLDLGYAYASTDKGNTGTSFYNDGEQPGDAAAEWHRRVTELTVATKEVVRQRYGRAPDRTYITGISNGGYLTRWQLENRPDLYDGGIDWEGTLFTPPGPHILTYLPVTLRNYREYKRGSEEAHQAILDAGFAPGSEFLWDYHYAVYWDLTQRVYREEFDPEFDGSLRAGIPFCQPGTPSCDADYEYGERPQEVKDAIGKGSVTGAIGKPMLTLHGTLDSLLPIRDTNVYVDMLRAAGKGGIHRYYTIDQGNHVDGLYDDYPDRLRPILPCQRAAFLALVRWVERGEEPPGTQFVDRPEEGDVVNECTLAAGSPRAEEPPGMQSAYAAEAGAQPAAEPAPRPDRLRARGLTARVTPRRDRRFPYRFVTRGRLIPPEGMPIESACGSGRVSVQVKVRGATISHRRTRLRHDCTYRSRVTFRLRYRLGRGRLKFVARFSGNAEVAPARARNRWARAR